MTRYLISFNEGAMTFPDEELPAVAEASLSVVAEARDAGVWVFGGGLLSAAGMSVVHPDGTVSDGPPAGRRDHIGGFSVLEVPSRAAAFEWAAKLAVACRCAQDIREFGPGSG